MPRLSIFRLPWRRRARLPTLQEQPIGRITVYALYRGIGMAWKPKPRTPVRKRDKHVYVAAYLGGRRIYARDVTEELIRGAHLVSWCAREYRKPLTLYVEAVDNSWLTPKRLAKLTETKVVSFIGKRHPHLALVARALWNYRDSAAVVLDDTAVPFGVAPGACGRRVTAVMLYPRLVIAAESYRVV